MMFDLINAMDGWIGSAFNGPMHRFSFSNQTGHSGVSVEKLLRKYGIRLWGRRLEGEGELSFLVKVKQAEWAEYVLCSAGVPLSTQLLNENHRGIAGKVPTPWTEEGIGAHTLVDHTVDWLERII